MDCRTTPTSIAVKVSLTETSPNGSVEQLLSSFIILEMYNFGHTATAQRTSTLAWKPRIFLCEISERKRASWIWIDFSQQQIAKMNDVRRFSLQLKPNNCYLVGISLTRHYTTNFYFLVEDTFEFHLHFLSSFSSFTAMQRVLSGKILWCNP